MSFIKVGEITISYRREGLRGAPKLVLLNSLGTDLRLWDAVVDQLRDAYDILTCDKPGHGLSDAPPGAYTIEQLARDVRLVMDVEGFERAAVCGLSVGGLIALHLTLTSPARVAALIVMDSAARVGNADMWNARIEAVRQGGMARIADQVLSRWFSPAYCECDPAAFAGWRNMLLRTDTEGYAGVCAALRDTDLTTDLPAITAPTLIMAGSEDLSTPLELVTATAAMIPGARFERIEGAGHLPCVEQPETVAALIDGFLKDIEHA